MWWQLRACIRHPQIAVVMATVLALVGAGLGIMGIATVLKEVKEVSEAQERHGLDYAFLAVLLTGLVIVLGGLFPLYQRVKD